MTSDVSDASLSGWLSEKKEKFVMKNTPFVQGIRCSPEDLHIPSKQDTLTKCWMNVDPFLLRYSLDECYSLPCHTVYLVWTTAMAVSHTCVKCCCDSRTILWIVARFSWSFPYLSYIDTSRSLCRFLPHNRPAWAGMIHVAADKRTSRYTDQANCRKIEVTLSQCAWKQDILTQCWFDVVPVLQTTAQH